MTNSDAVQEGRLEALAIAMTSSNSDNRKQCEASINEWKSMDPQSMVAPLLNICTKNLSLQYADAQQRDAIKLFCAVLLRQCLLDESVSESSVALNSRPHLLHLITSDDIFANNEPTIYRRIIDIVIAMATHKKITKKSPWPELLSTMWIMLRSSSSTQHEGALRIVDKLAEFDYNGIQQYVPQISTLLLQVLSSESASCASRIAAIRASVSLLVVMDDEKAKQFAASGLMECLLNAIGKSSDEDTVRSVLSSLLELVRYKPSLFVSVVPNVAQTMKYICCSSNLQAETHSLANEMLLSLSESCALIRRQNILLQTTLLLALDKLVTHVQVQQTQNDDDDELEEQIELCRESIRRLTVSFGIDDVLSLCGSSLSAWSSPNASLKHRVAALLSLASICDGLSNTHETNHDDVSECASLNALLQQCSKLVRACLTDSFVSVRSAALELLIVQCSRKNNINDETQPLLPLLGQLLLDSASNIAEQAADAIAEFAGGLYNADDDDDDDDDDEDEAAEQCKLKSLIGFEQALKGLATILSSPDAISTSPHRPLLGSCLTATAALAQALSDRFTPFYDAFMPVVISIPSQAGVCASHRGKAIEAAGLIGSAVGKTLFGNDAIILVRQLISLNIDSAQEEWSFIQQTLSRICSVIGDDFLPFLSSVIPPLITSASLDDGCRVETISDTTTKPLDNDELQFVDVSVRGLGERRIVLNTSVMEERALAANLLYQYACDLKGGFSAFVSSCFDVLLPLVKCAYNEQLRLAACAAMPKLLNSMMLAPSSPTNDDISRVCSCVLPSLVGAIGVEPDVYVLMLILESVAEFIKLAPASTLLIKDIDIVAVALKEIFNEIDERANKRKICLSSPDTDSLEVAHCEKEYEADQALAGHMVDCFQYMSRALKQDIVPIFKTRLEATFSKRLSSPRDVSELTLALCVFDEILEYGGSSAISSYLSETLPYFVRHCLHNDIDVRQSAVYGVGVCAQMASDAVFQPYTSDVCVALNALITDQEASNARDNALSALLKLMLFQSAVLLSDGGVAMMSTVIQCLPCVNDEIEALVIHENFSQLVKRNSSTLLSSSSSMINDTLCIIAKLILLAEDANNNASSTRIVSQKTYQHLRTLWIQFITPKINESNEWMLLLSTRLSLTAKQINAFITMQ